jgi:hypothetical protein
MVAAGTAHQANCHCGAVRKNAGFPGKLMMFRKSCADQRGWKVTLS